MIAGVFMLHRTARGTRGMGPHPHAADSRRPRDDTPEPPLTASRNLTIIAGVEGIERLKLRQVMILGIEHIVR